MALQNELLDINWSEPFEMAAPPSEDSIPEDYIECLQKSFGHSRFRAMQWDVISSILNNARDNCVIMATGYGKSLCYQFPSVYRNTITIVVSPLISLMQDQVIAMRFYNLRACFLGSAQSKRETIYEVIDHQYNIVYVTPEYITSESGTFLLERIRDNLTLIAIDEAHCISKWGHDFRHAYRNLSELRNLCPAVPILAMTATATAQVRDDIVKSLKLRNAQIISTGFDRPNLEFMVKQKTKVWPDIGPYIKNVKIGSIIVYCISRRVTEEVASVIEANGLLCGVYHAGLNIKQRQKTHDDFLHDRIRVIVATIAFGMGINKPDVRLVIHYGVARDVESYYQEAGRAGRDGLPAKCLMFHQPKDWALHRMIREKTKLKTSKDQMENLMLAMGKYIDTTQCRRSFILSYFGEDCRKLIIRPDCCDNCRRRPTSSPTKTINLFSKYQGLDENGLLDITDEAYKMISLLKDMAGRYGLRKAFLVLKGSKSKSLPKSFERHPFYGSLKDKSDKWLQAVSNSLLHINMLSISQMAQSNILCSYVHSTCTVTAKAKVWLSGVIKPDPIKVVPGEEFIRLLKPKVLGIPKILGPTIEKSYEKTQLPSIAAATSSSSTTEAATSSTSSITDIYRPLLKVRSKLASLFDAMPYLVASTRALQELANHQPTTMEELRKIKLDGYSEEKTERFGPVFLKVIRDYHAKIGKVVEVEKMPQETENVDQNATTIKFEPAFQATLVQPFSNTNKVISLVSDDENENSNTKHESISNGCIKQDTNLNGLPKNGNIDENSQSSQESIEIIEPPPPPLIEIESDIENAVFGDWESDVDDEELAQVTAKVENSQLDLLINALKSEELNQQQENAKTTRILKRNPSSNAFEYEDKTDSESDIFDGDWDLEIDDSDLTQISEQAEKQLQCDADGEVTSPSEVRVNGQKTERDPFVNNLRLNLNKNQKEKKPRIIERKVSQAFEYEDDSDTESESEKKPVVSPKKRVLPSWMELSNKKKR